MINSNIVSHLHLGLPKVLFPADVPDKNLKAPLPFSILATWPAPRNLLDLITLTILGEWYKVWISLLWSLLYSPLVSLLGPNICLRTLFSTNCSLHSSLNATSAMVFPNNLSSSEVLCDVSQQIYFYSVRLLASSQTSKLDDLSWSTVHDFLFNIFAANPHIWRPTPHLQPRWHAMPWWQEPMKGNNSRENFNLIQKMNPGSPAL